MESKIFGVLSNLFPLSGLSLLGWASLNSCPFFLPLRINYIGFFFFLKWLSCHWKFHSIFLGEIVFETYLLPQALTGIFYSKKGWSAWLILSRETLKGERAKIPDAHSFCLGGQKTSSPPSGGRKDRRTGRQTLCTGLPAFCFSAMSIGQLGVLGLAGVGETSPLLVGYLCILFLLWRPKSMRRNKA